MIILKGAVIINLLIDGNDLPSLPGLVGMVSLVEGNGMMFPACLITLYDSSDSLSDDLNLTDGNSIHLTVGKNAENPETVLRKYRLFGFRTRPYGNATEYTICGIIDSPEFTTASIRESFKGSSQDVLKAVAASCGLEFDPPEVPTNDAKIWLNICKSRGAFVQDVVRQGWVSERSGMSAVLTSLGVLKYKDLMQLIEKTPTHTLYYNANPPTIQGVTSYAVAETESRSSTGLTNTWQNYGSTLVNTGLDGKSDVHRAVSVETNGEYLPVNADISKAVSNSKVAGSNLECGNGHTNQVSSTYQNLRLLGLFTLKESLLVYEATDIQLYDVIYYIAGSNTDTNKYSSKSGVYLIFGKTIFIKDGNRYAERLEIARMYVDEPGSANLANDPRKLKLLALPEVVINPYLEVASQTLPLATSVNSYFEAVSKNTKELSTSTATLASDSVAMEVAVIHLRSYLAAIPEGIMGSTTLVPGAIQALDDIHLKTGKLVENLGICHPQVLEVLSTSTAGVTIFNNLPPELKSSALRARMNKTIPYQNAGGIVGMLVGFSATQMLAYNSALYLISALNANGFIINLLLTRANAYIRVNALSSLGSGLRVRYRAEMTSLIKCWNTYVGFMHNVPPLTSGFDPYAGNIDIIRGILSEIRLVDERTQQTQTINHLVDFIASSLQQNANGDLPWIDPTMDPLNIDQYTADDLTLVSGLAKSSNSSCSYLPTTLK